MKRTNCGGLAPTSRLGISLCGKLIGIASLILAASVSFGGSAVGEVFRDGVFRCGCNYWASHAGIFMWRNWNPGRVESDLDKLAANGMSVLRVFPLWPDFQPLTSQYGCVGKFRGWSQNGEPLRNYAAVDDEMIERFRFLCRAAEKRGQRLVVGLVTGWMSGRLFVPPALERKNPITDAESIMWQTRFVKYFVECLRNEKGIVAWDLGNECDCLGHSDRAQFRNWMHSISSTIRLADPTRPVVSGMHGVKSVSDPDFAQERVNARDQGELIDILTTHPYPLWTPGMNTEPFDGIRNVCHAACETTYYADLSGKPAFVEEAGSMGPQIVSEERAAKMLRASLFSTWAANIDTYCWWCAFDQNRLDYSPYDWTAIERELGLFTFAGEPKPTALAMRDFTAFIKTLPFKVLPKRKIDAVVVISERENFWPQAMGAWTLARESGFDVRFAGAERELPESKFYILPSGSSYQTYSAKAFHRVMDKAREGATVLVTLGNGAVLSDTRECFGIKVENHYRLQNRIELDFGKDSFGFVESHRRELTVKEATTILRDKSGASVMTAMKLGKGKVLYFNGALEVNANISGWPVYALAAKEAGVRRLVKKGDPMLGISEHVAVDGRTFVVAVNLSNEDKTFDLEIDGTLGKVWRGKIEGSALSLAGLDAAVFEIAGRPRPEAPEPRMGS